MGGFGSSVAEGEVLFPLAVLICWFALSTATDTGSLKAYWTSFSHTNSRKLSLFDGGQLDSGERRAQCRLFSNAAEMSKLDVFERSSFPLLMKIRGGSDDVDEGGGDLDKDGAHNQDDESSPSLVSKPSNNDGADSMNDAELDAYVDALIKEYEERTITREDESEASLVDETAAVALDDDDDAKETGVHDQDKIELEEKREQSKPLQIQEERQSPSTDTAKDSRKSVASPDIPLTSAMGTGTSSSSTKGGAKKSKKRKKTSIAGTSSVAESSSSDQGKKEPFAEETVESGAVNATTTMGTAAEASRRQQRQEAASEQSKEMELFVPPNAFFRFLLNRGGPLGHMVVTTLVVAKAFLDVYLPVAPAVFLWVLQKTRIYDYRRQLDLAKRRQYQQRQRGLGVAPGRGRVVNQKYGGIVSADTMTGASKRAVKLQVRAADQTAMDQLRRVGNIDNAKYRLLSKDFMQRHGLGRYKPKDDSPPLKGMAKSLSREVSKRSVDDEIGSPSLALDDLVGDNDDEAEDADDWVVQALQQEVANDEKDEAKSSRKRRFRTPETSISIGTDSRGKGRMEVGLEFSFGSKEPPPPPSSSRSAVLEAAAASRHSASKSSKKLRPQTRRSDRDGGGGVFGQLRAFHANNAVSARLFGAYPGDAPSLEEAASADGVIELAKRYGYGEWDDDDDDDDEEDDERDLESGRSRRGSVFTGTLPTRFSGSRRRRPKGPTTATAQKSASTKGTKRKTKKKVPRNAPAVGLGGEDNADARVEAVRKRAKKAVELRRGLTSEPWSTETPPKEKSKQLRPTTTTKRAAKTIVKTRRGIINSPESSRPGIPKPPNGSTTAPKRTVDEARKLTIRRRTTIGNDTKSSGRSSSTTTTSKTTTPRPSLVVRPKQKDDKTE